MKLIYKEPSEQIKESEKYKIAKRLCEDSFLYKITENGIVKIYEKSTRKTTQSVA